MCIRDRYDSDDAEDDAEEAENVEVEAKPKPTPKRRSETRAAAAPLPTTLPATKESATSSIWFDNPLFRDMAPPEALVSKRRETADKSTGKAALDEMDADDDIEVVPRGEADVPDGAWNMYGEDTEAAKQERIKQYGLNTAEAVTMAQALVNRDKTKTDLVDEGFNKHTFTDKSDLCLLYTSPSPRD